MVTWDGIDLVANETYILQLEACKGLYKGWVVAARACFGGSSADPDASLGKQCFLRAAGCFPRLLLGGREIRKACRLRILWDSALVEQARWAGAVVSNDAMGELFLILAISEASVACNLAARMSHPVPHPALPLQGSCTAAGIRANYVRLTVRLPALQSGNVLQISGDVATVAWLRTELTCH